MKIVNIAAYKFLPLTDLRALRTRLQTLCKDANLKGTILLSHEGINLFVAGEAHNIERLLAELRTWPGLADLQPKLSETDHQPFRRMLVRLKKEIIAFGVEGIDPSRRTSPKLSAKELKRWLDEGRPVTLLDTRNDYEVKLGTFRNALPIGIDHFRDFPGAEHCGWMLKVEVPKRGTHHLLLEAQDESGAWTVFFHRAIKRTTDDAPPPPNTYAAWVLRQAAIHHPLSPRALGKNYRWTNPLPTPSAPDTPHR